MVAQWADYADPGYLSFIEEVRPGVAQVGFYGAHFWSLADTPFGRANYFYRHDCHCPYCVKDFRHYLRARFPAGALKRRFAITNLDTHQFDEIVGWHDPGQSTPLRREMLRFSQIANKEAFDEVLVQFAKSVKPDLIVAQWNHLGDFNQISGDERCLLPGELWGRDEDYLWYSTGNAANFTDLASGALGEATLQARYIRGAFDRKPFTLGKYESVRIRVSIAELAANGGAPMGFYADFKDPDTRRELVRYHNFLRRHETLYRESRSHAEVLLLFPRSRVHDGDVAAVDRFRELGRRLLDGHVLFDILPDDRTPGLRSHSASRSESGAKGVSVRRIEFLTPEADQARELEFEQLGARLRFRIPDFLVYGVVRVELSKSE
jgi:hypothetical protein